MVRSAVALLSPFPSVSTKVHREKSYRMSSNSIRKNVKTNFDVNAKNPSTKSRLFFPPNDGRSVFLLPCSQTGSGSYTIVRAQWG